MSLSFSLLYTEMSRWLWDGPVVMHKWWWETTESWQSQTDQLPKRKIFSKDRECALNIHKYSLGSEKALLSSGTLERCCCAYRMLWQPWTALDVWTCPQQNSFDGEDCGVSSPAGKRAKQKGPLTSIMRMSVLLLVFALFFVALLFQSEVGYGGERNRVFTSGPIKNMCNIHTISPLNCTHQIKMLLWKFRKVQIKKDVK